MQPRQATRPGRPWKQGSATPIARNDTEMKSRWERRFSKPFRPTCLPARIGSSRQSCGTAIIARSASSPHLSRAVHGKATPLLRRESHPIFQLPSVGVSWWQGLHLSLGQRAPCDTPTESNQSSAIFPHERNAQNNTRRQRSKNHRRMIMRRCRCSSRWCLRPSPARGPRYANTGHNN